jgi:hypothetical protein
VSRSRAIGEPLARYRDPAGIEHALVLISGRAGQLLIDRSPAGPRVVAELGEGEGREQALAILRDADGNTEGLNQKPPIEGYLVRAARSDGPLCRLLTSEDLLEPGARLGKEAA